MTSQTSDPATFTATEEEEQLATQILVIKSCHTTGILNADAAIDIFKRSGLPIEVLRDIWTLSDRTRSGDFSRDELTVAVRLMGWVQAGETLHERLLAKQGPLPTLDGISDVMKRSAAIPAVPPQIPRIKPDEVRDYRRIFTRAGPVDGFLEGDKVMAAFMTSNLSYEHLRKIHNVVDKSQRGTLEFREFALGMHLIHALQACYIFSVPSSIPRDLYQQFAELKIPDLPQPEALTLPSHRSKPSLQVTSSTSSRGSRISPAGSSTGSSSPKPSDREDKWDWDVTPQQKQEFDNYFYKLDPERKGYVDEDTAASFMLAYQLPPGDLAHIWGLVALNRDDYLTIDEFAIAMHLIQRKSAGEELPKTLPPSLVPPSLRSQFAPKIPPTSPKSSPINKGKPPPPPPPKRERSIILNGQNPISMRSQSISHVPSNSKYSVPLSPPVSPKPPRLRSQSILVAGPSPSNVANPASTSFPEVLSPFDDPAHQPLRIPPLRHHTPPVRSPSPSPRPPDTPNNDALEEFKKETARLSAQVESLLSQLTAQSRLRDSNENLRNENDSLKSQLRDMERTVSEVLSANDLNGSQEQLTQEITRLNAELVNKESQAENAERMLALLTQDEQELRASLREAQAGVTKAKTETDELRQTVATQAEEIKDLSGRLADMSNAMAEPNPAANNRQLRLVFKDVTKENEKLKGELREMQKSMEQLLLSTKFHAQYDELDRENRRMKQHIQELEIIATTSQSSQHGNGNGRLSKQNSNPHHVETLTKENELLKSQLRDGQRAFADFRSTSETKAVDLQQQIDSLTHENNRLKIDAQSSTRTRPQEDNNVPPPSYDDSFVVPP